MVGSTEFLVQLTKFDLSKNFVESMKHFILSIITELVKPTKFFLIQPNIFLSNAKSELLISVLSKIN